MQFFKILPMKSAIIETAKEELAEALKSNNPEKAKRAIELLEEAFEKRIKELESEKLTPFSFKIDKHHNELEKHDEKIKEVETSLRDLIDIVRTELRTELGSIRREMNARFEAVDKRFEAMDKRFEALREEMNARFEAVEKRISFLQWVIVFLVGIPSWGMILLNLAHFFK